jgi:glycerol-3-phosphate dehydrogenase
LSAIGKDAVRWLARKIHADKSSKGSSTAKLSRSHIIEVSDSGLVSLMGGKWTSFRVMGEETIDKVLEGNKKMEPKH